MARKVSVIGAGAVGATLAQRVLESGLADVALIDILKNIAQAKAFDLSDASAIAGHERSITGTSDLEAMKASDIVVITAGLPRKPGMTREDLISKNATIVRGVASAVKTYAPGAIVIVVTNPLDVMTYLTYKTTGFKPEHVFGMAGVLDGSRFVYLLAEALKVRRSSIETCIMGSHGDTMVPIISKTLVSGKPVTSLLPKEKIDEIVSRTRDRGAEIVKLLGNGSAYYSPSAGAYQMVRSILTDSKETLTASAYLSGEYGLSDIYIGVPCRIGKNGIEEIVEIALSADEKSALRKSAEMIKSSIELL